VAGEGTEPSIKDEPSMKDESSMEDKISMEDHPTIKDEPSIDGYGHTEAGSKSPICHGKGIIARLFE
jgi:hypothetical protein